MNPRHVLLEQGHQRLVRGRHGYVLYNRNDTVIGRSIETYGEYFEAEVDVFRRFLRPGDVALDIGANIGTHTLAMARLVGPQGFVFAFEPQRLVFQTLCANMALNALTNVHCVNAAVGEKPGWLHISDPDPGVAENFGGVQLTLMSGSAQAAPVAQVTLDEFVAVTQVKLIKVDVEGMEAAVLRGGVATLSRFRPILYVENAIADKSADLLTLLRDLGYVCFWHLPLFVTDDNYFADTRRIFPVAFVDGGGAFLDAIGLAVNLLCVPDSSGLSIRGLRQVRDPLEHPFRREHAALFTASDGSAIPVRTE
jgi:FkbM family methyltransferase